MQKNGSSKKNLIRWEFLKLSSSLERLKFLLNEKLSTWRTSIYSQPQVCTDQNSRADIAWKGEEDPAINSEEWKKGLHICSVHQTLENARKKIQTRVGNRPQRTLAKSNNFYISQLISYNSTGRGVKSKC